MNRKLITIAVAAIAGLALVAGALVALLYAGQGSKVDGGEALKDYDLLSSVPTDAIAVVIQQDLSSTIDFYTVETSLAWAPMASAASPAFRAFLRELGEMASSRKIQSLKNSSSLVSFHYNGELFPLLVVKDPKGGDERSEDATRVGELADTLGLYSAWSDSRLLVSTSDVLLQSAIRHQQSGTCVAEAHGFADAAKAAHGKNVVFVCMENCGKIFSTIVAKPYLKYADFFKSLGSWAVFSLDEAGAQRATVTGTIDCSEGVQQFMKAFGGIEPAEQTVAGMLPERTTWAFSLPTVDMSAYVKAYQSYADSKIGISKFLAKQKELQTAAGLAPKAWFSALDVKEAAVAGFDVNGEKEQFILLKVTTPDAVCKAGVNDFPYAGFAGSLLGSLYNVIDESHCTFRDGWLVIGSEAGVSAYVDGGILASKLSDSAAFASHADVAGGKTQLGWFWFPVTGNAPILRDMFQPNVEAGIEAASYSNIETFEMAVLKGKNGVSLVMDLTKPEPVAKKKKAAEEEIQVPEGPFPVKNTGTGKEDMLSLADGMLTLTEDGAELWSVPFDGRFCGRVANVDKYKNGKIQFLFCSNISLCLYDRLGRMCDGFPVSLEQPVLLGPDVYDFSGNRNYNVIVLNQDYTVDMYNLQGKKPSSWKTIAPSEKPVGMPESIRLGNTNYWVIYTANKTMVFPFYGGEMLKEFEGRMPADQITLE